MSIALIIFKCIYIVNDEYLSHNHKINNDVTNARSNKTTRSRFWLFKQTSYVNFSVSLPDARTCTEGPPVPPWPSLQTPSSWRTLERRRRSRPSAAGAGSEASRHRPDCWGCLLRPRWSGYATAIAGSDPNFQGNAATRQPLQVFHLSLSAKNTKQKTQLWFL